MTDHRIALTVVSVADNFVKRWTVCSLEELTRISNATVFPNKYVAYSRCMTCDEVLTSQYDEPIAMILLALELHLTEFPVLIQQG